MLLGIQDRCECAEGAVATMLPPPRRGVDDLDRWGFDTVCAGPRGKEVELVLSEFVMVMAPTGQGHQHHTLGGQHSCYYTFSALTPILYT